MIYFPTNWGAKEPRNLPNHRVVKVTTMIITHFFGEFMDAKLNFNFIFSIGILSGGSIPPKEKHTVWPKLSKKNGQSLHVFFFGDTRQMRGDLKKTTLIGGYMAECPSQACVVGGVENPKKIEFSR